MTAAEFTGIVQARITELIAESEDELGRALDDDERESIIDSATSALDDDDDDGDDDDADD